MEGGDNELISDVISSLRHHQNIHGDIWNITGNAAPDLRGEVTTEDVHQSMGFPPEWMRERTSHWTMNSSKAKVVSLISVSASGEVLC